MSTDQPTATATPVYRFSLASWLSIYGRTCLMDFVKETDYATLERALAEAKREATAQGEHAVAMTEHAQSLQAALAKAKAEVAEIRKNHGGLLLLMAERDQLRARVAELEQDKARLDWLEDNGHHIHVSCWHASPAKENEWTIHDGDFDSEPIGADKLLRAAIDAAKGQP